MLIVIRKVTRKVENVLDRAVYDANRIQRINEM